MRTVNLGCGSCVVMEDEEGKEETMRFVTIVVFVLTALPVGATEPVLWQNFADGPGGWISMGENAALHTAEGSLQFTYTTRPASLSLAYLPVANLPIGEFQSLKFEVRTDVPMPVAVVLSESKPGGGNYNAVVWSVGPLWQNVVLVPADFAVSDGPTDPVDADHRLDPDQVETVAFLDLGQLFSSLASRGNAPFHVETHDGTHTISIRAFEISRDPLPAAANDVVDNFSTAMSSWFTPGGASFEQNGGALSISYRQLAEEFVAFVRQVPAHNYKAATHLTLDVASDRPAQLIIAITERRSGAEAGARYHGEFFVPGGGKLDHRELSLAALDLDENGPPDPDRKLNSENIQSIAIVDMTGESANNTLTLRDLRLVKR